MVLSLFFFILALILTGSLLSSLHVLSRSWPETIKKEFSGQLHRFMASLTETAWDARGKTTLYIPSEDLESVEAAAKQKDVVQRLESTLIHWTRQVCAPSMTTRASSLTP